MRFPLAPGTTAQRLAWGPNGTLAIACGDAAIILDWGYVVRELASAGGGGAHPVFAPAALLDAGSVAYEPSGGTVLDMSFSPVS